MRSWHKSFILLIIGVLICHMCTSPVSSVQCHFCKIVCEICRTQNAGHRPKSGWMTRSSKGKCINNYNLFQYKNFHFSLPSCSGVSHERKMGRKNRSDEETTSLAAASVVVDRHPSSELITFVEAIPVTEGNDRSLALENEGRLVNIPILNRPNPRNSQLVVCKSCSHRGYTRTKTFHNCKSYCPIVTVCFLFSVVVDFDKFLLIVLAATLFVLFVYDTFKHTEHYCSYCNDLIEVVPPRHDCGVKYGGPGSEQQNGSPGSEQPNDESHQMIEKNNIREGNIANV